MIVNASASLSAAAILLKGTGNAALNISGKFQLRPSNGVPTGNAVDTFSIAGATNAWTGRLDLSDNSIIISPSTSAAKTTLLALSSNQILSGFHNGDWLGNGITSSTAALDPTHSGVGLFDNALLNLTTLNSINLTSVSFFLSYALLGDANFDGHVDATDLAIISANWHTAENTWSAGDLNYDGFVDNLDVAIVVNHWGSSSPYTPLISYTPGFSFTFAMTPEPTSLVLLALGTAPLLLKRRSRTTAFRRPA